MLFELSDADDQGTPVKVTARDGRPVVLLRRGEMVDDVVGELNELLDDDTRHDPAAALGEKGRPRIVVVVVR